MSGSSATAQPKLVVKTFPTEAEFALMREGLDASHNALDEFSSFIRNVWGDVSTETWEARLTEPPTLENIGTLVVHLDYMRWTLRDFGRLIDELKADAVAELDHLRIESKVRSEVDVRWTSEDEQEENALRELAERVERIARQAQEIKQRVLADREAEEDGDDA